MSDIVAGPSEPKHWDARWNATQRADALALAHEYVSDARHELDVLLREFDATLKTFVDAGEWLATATHLKLSADAREVKPA